MQVKCQICGKSIDRNLAFKITAKNGVNKYYCSEQEYNKDIKNKADKRTERSNFLKMVYDFIGYTNNAALYQEEKLWVQSADYKMLTAFLVKNVNKIRISMNKDFTSEYAKIRYFSAIIKNGINDFKNQYKEERPIIKQANTEVYDTKYKSPPKRKCLNDYYEVIKDG